MNTDPEQQYKDQQLIAENAALKTAALEYQKTAEASAKLVERLTEERDALKESRDCAFEDLSSARIESYENGKAAMSIMQSRALDSVIREKKSEHDKQLDSLRAELSTAQGSERILSQMLGRCAELLDLDPQKDGPEDIAPSIELRLKQLSAANAAREKAESHEKRECEAVGKLEQMRWELTKERDSLAAELARVKEERDQARKVMHFQAAIDLAAERDDLRAKLAEAQGMRAHWSKLYTSICDTPAQLLEALATVEAMREALKVARHWMWAGAKGACKQVDAALATPSSTILHEYTLKIAERAWKDGWTMVSGEAGA